MTQNNRAEVSDERLASLQEDCAALTRSSVGHWRYKNDSVTFAEMNAILTELQERRSEPTSAVQVTEEMVRTFIDVSRDENAGYTCWTDAVYAALTAALSQSQPAPQPDADRWAAMDDMTFAKEVASLAQDLCGHPITAILASAAERIAVRPQPDAKASGVDWKRSAQDYIRDWCPDHVKDYIDSLTTPPTEAGVEEPEVAACRWRYRNPITNEWSNWIDGHGPEKPNPDDEVEEQSLIRLSDHNTIVERLKRERSEILAGATAFSERAEQAESALTTERERCARLREVLELARDFLCSDREIANADVEADRMADVQIAIDAALRGFTGVG